MRSIHIWVASLALVWAACEAKASCGKPSKKKVQKEIVKALKSVGVNKVDCPDIEKGKTVPCKATTPDGRTFNIEVTYNDDGVRWKTKELAKGLVVQADIEAQYRKLGLNLVRMRCPDLIEPKKAAECSGTTEGIAVKVRVALTEKPEYKVLSGVHSVDEIIGNIHRQDPKLEGMTFKCPVKLIVAKPGKQQRCSAHAPTGEKLVLAIEILDDKGKFKWEIVRPTKPGAPIKPGAAPGKPGGSTPAKPAPK